MALPVLLGLVVVALLVGLVNMAIGGKGTESRSNRFMQWRVGLQAAVIVVIALIAFFGRG